MSNKKLTISAIFDYIVEISGAFDFKQNQNFTLKNKPEIKLMVISATTEKAYCLSSSTSSDFSVGEEVVLSNFEDKIFTSELFFGSIIDINGEIVYPSAKTKVIYEDQSTFSYPFNKPNLLMNYQPLQEQLKTGYISVDLLIPVGKGQRQLIIGDRKTGKTFIALNAIINQRNTNVKCIYVAIGQQHSQVAETYKLLSDHDAMKNTFILSASASNPYEQFLAPYIAMAHAENLSHKYDVLVVFDDLSAHANIYREMALLTNKPVGKEAFPGDMFFAHARLLERAGKFVGKKTITALPILQTVDNDITSLVSSNVISITDGQIVTNSELFASGKIPAIDFDLSVSRIGASVLNSFSRKTAAEISKIYKAYKKQTKLASLKYDLNDETNALISNGLLIENMFKQVGVSLYSDQTIFLTSKLISWGLLKDIPNTQQAITFLSYLIEEDQLAQTTFDSILNNENIDEANARNFFAFALKEFSDFNHLNWNIQPEAKFLKFSEQLLETITKKMEAN